MATKQASTSSVSTTFFVLKSVSSIFTGVTPGSPAHAAQFGTLSLHDSRLDPVKVLLPVQEALPIMHCCVCCILLAF